MPYVMKVDGMAEISEALDQLEKNAAAAAAQGLYEGAGVMADEVNKAAADIRTEPFKYAARGARRLASPEEKAIVQQAAAGIAKFQTDGTEIDTSVGFRNAGYAELDGKTRPIPVIVNSINSGTSFMKKQPFIRKGANTNAQKAMTAMSEKIENALNEIINKK